jgi:hypothetical protein
LNCCIAASTPGAVGEFRAEAERNVKILTKHLDVNIPGLLWDRDVVKVVRTAVPKAGYVDVTLPPPPISTPGEGLMAPERNVWPVALSSGSLALLPEATAQMYARVDFEAGEDVKEVDRLHEASARGAQFELATGYRIRPNVTMHLTLAQQDQLITVMSMSAQQLYALLRRRHLHGAMPRGPQGLRQCRVADGLGVEPALSHGSTPRVGGRSSNQLMLTDS